MTKVAQLRGLVLAGGQSRRMGKDKAGLEHAGATLLDRAVKLLQVHIDNVHVSIRPDQQQDSIRRSHALIKDELADIGPAAGILAAHRAYPESAWFVVACDLPYLSDTEVSALIAARRAGHAVTAWSAVRRGEPEPLCAIYEPGNLASFAAHVATGGRPSPKAWLKNCDAHLLISDSRRAFTNVNTPEDLNDLED
jgi:molybdenum cofactor guanylyltransferase